MDPKPAGKPILAKDIQAKSIERRTFLGRFGVAAGAAGILGWTTGCAALANIECDGDSAGTDTVDTFDRREYFDLCRAASPPSPPGACDSDRGDRKTADADPTDPAASTDSDSGDPCGP